MATDTREQPPSPTVAMGLEEADAKMVVATGHGDCQKLKDLVSQQDHPTTTMLVVMASSNKASLKKPCCASMHPLLAAAACRGNLEELKFLLLKREAGPPTTEPRQDDPSEEEFLNQAKAYKITNDDNTTSARIMGQQATAGSDVEQGAINNSNHDDDAVVPLSLNGVTVEGDTVLHLVAANGDAHNFLACANFIHGLKLEGGSLLFKENHNGDTPLHCAARAGRTNMVSRLIHLAQRAGIVLEQLLRKENNRKETALHEAVRFGDDGLVTELLRADGELARFPEEGTSPLYVAISLGMNQIAKTLHHDESGNNRRTISYSGPEGQNALHAAVLRGPELTRMVLEWNTNKDLTTKRDKNGSTPLHFAAGLLRDWRGRVFSQVLKANTGAVYQPDNEGSYPIHVAASAGAKHAIELIVRRCGGTSAGLRDAKWRTFLHVAVGERKMQIVSYACGNRSLAWIMNMQDIDGNTALHLTVKAGSLRMFSALVANRHVELNLANAERETPLDIAYNKMSPGLFYNQSSEDTIFRTLSFLVCGRMGNYHRDHFKEKYEQIQDRTTERDKKHMKNVKDTTKTLCIGSVLIASVTFSATFALPGGYRADDHTNGGTATLAGRYAFDAFVIANTFAFTLSSGATVLLIRAGSPSFNTWTRDWYSSVAYAIVDVSVTFLVAAFALAVYVVLGPVAPITTIMACVFSLPVVLCSQANILLSCVSLAPALFVRCGALRSLLAGPFVFLDLLLLTFGPFASVLILACAKHGWNHPTASTLAPAPAPAPAPLS